jgi:hypothetical protein
MGELKVTVATKYLHCHASAKVDLDRRLKINSARNSVWTQPLRLLLCALAFTSCHALSNEAFKYSGHLKLGAQQTHLGDNSDYRGFNNLRLNAEYQRGGFALETALQSSDQDVDRLALSYRNSNNLLVAGRSIISWGNGLIFNPLDFFNPFSPVALDTEYKPGVDMLYWQHSTTTRDDWQVLGVRKDGQNSSAIRYRTVSGVLEWTATLASHRHGELAAWSFNLPIGGALLSSDVLHTRTSEGDAVSSGVVNIQHWVGVGDHTLSLAAEYFHNGFGLAETPISPFDLLQKPELANRLAAGELFTLGRDYTALSIGFDPHPLWQTRLSHLYNLRDHSALLFWHNSFDSSESTRFSLTATIPLGPSNKEYTGLFGSQRIDAQIQAQFAWYF